MERLLILDGNSLMNRAFYGLPPLTTPEGLYTNAIYGFTNMLYKMKEELKPDYIVTTFDKKAPTFRHIEYKDYKAGRKKMPPELAEQFPIVKELLEKMAIDIFEIEGFEADDLIGTLAVLAESKGIEVFVITGDKDALQLASENIKVVITKKGFTEKEIYTGQRMIDDFGVTSTQFIDVKGLMGDASDNIPGVPGIGEKTAFKLIKEYGSIENLLENLDSLKGKIKENLTNYSEDAIFSKKLATIMTNVPVDIDLESIKSSNNYDVEGIRQLFHKLQFNSLLEKLPKATVEEVEVVSCEIINITSKEMLNIIETIDENVFITYEVSGSELYSKIKLEILNIYNNGKIYRIKLKNIVEINSLLDLSDNAKEVDIAELSDIEITDLKSFFQGDIRKVIHNAKPLYTVLIKNTIEINNLIFDTEIAAYLIDSSQGEYKLKGLISKYLHSDVKEDDICNGICYMERLFDVLKAKIDELKMEELLYKIELPLVKILSSMEVQGFNIDRGELDALGVKFKFEIQKVQDEIFAFSEEEFNINSPKQLGKILFEKLDLPVIKKTKTGYSTNVEVLEKLMDKHPIIEKVMNYRHLAKISSTYIEGLKSVIDLDGKIHSNFNQTVTTTGRLSSTEPNLQNIPIKTEMGRAIRKVFIPMESGCKILSADYSQIELRVLADISGDTNMISAFIEHCDIHTKTASEVFNVPLEEVTSAMRSAAKAVNFGIVYGIGDFSLSQDLKISKAEARKYIDTYFERYPRVKEYIDEIILMAKKDLMVTTLLNRRRFIPEIGNSNKIVQSFGERLAMNAPIQGSAADIMKIAMVKVYDRLNLEKLKSKMILQVHDEIIVNVYEDEIEVVSKIVKEEMEGVLQLKVPLEVDVKIGNTWYEAK